MTTEWLLLGLVVVLLAASAFFVAAEFALIAARRSVIEPVAVNSARARSTLKAMEHVSLMMACAQLGITLCGVLLGALGEPAVAALLEPVFHALGVPEAWLHPVSLVIALLLVVSAHVAFGEMVPKNIAIADPERTALALAPALRAIATAIGPIIRSLNWCANSVVKLTGREPKDEVASAFTREEVAELVAESRREGLLDDEEHQLITSALGFDTTVVSAVMVPIAEVVAASAAVTPAEIERMCARTGFSRFPVRVADGAGTGDGPSAAPSTPSAPSGSAVFAGYLHIRDVVDLPAQRRDQPVPAERIRELPTVAPTTDLRTALDRMRRIGAHLAQLVTADGAVVGVVMLEDVIEALIGEVQDATRRTPGRPVVALRPPADGPEA
ncbi:hemolysin family protein [Nakamurella sp.]|uniref:hemolysin family protein n=1 Tax=Nakamurella sp. TaxID=1869182 RepID=UPI003B3B7F33